MKQSYLIAATIVIVVSLWMLSGVGGDDEQVVATVEEQASSETGKLLTRVKVESYRATPMTREVVINGSSEARRSVTVRAEVPGRVEQVAARRGAAVEAGTLLFRLAVDEREQQRVQARASLRQRELEYKAAKSLKQKGLKAESQLAESASLLEAARSQLQHAELNLKRTAIKAPFDGVVQQHLVEVGDYLGVGDPLALFLERDPLVIGGEVSEREVGQLRLGMEAEARLVGGESLRGRISYIAPAASTETRSFRVELEAPNPQGLAAGVTASIHVPISEVSAHTLSPALLSLDDEGNVGVKTVDNKGLVQFHPVELLRADSTGLWLAGLPAVVDLITVGQGFVRAGDRVEVSRGE